MNELIIEAGRSETHYWRDRELFSFLAALGPGLLLKALNMRCRDFRLIKHRAMPAPIIRVENLGRCHRLACVPGVEVQS